MLCASVSPALQVNSFAEHMASHRWRVL